MPPLSLRRAVGTQAGNLPPASGFLFVMTHPNKRGVGFFSSHVERCHWNEPAVSQFSSTSPHIQVILYTCWARAPRRPDHARLSTRLTPLSIQTPVTHSPAARRFFSLRAGLSSVSSQTDLLLPSRLPLFTPLARPCDPTGPSAPQL